MADSKADLLLGSLSTNPWFGALPLPERKAMLAAADTVPVYRASASQPALPLRGLPPLQLGSFVSSALRITLGLAGRASRPHVAEAALCDIRAMRWTGVVAGDRFFVESKLVRVHSSPPVP